MLLAQWRYRSFIFGLVKRDFKTQYLNSMLGALWPILHPLSQIAVYTLIFSQVMSSRLPGLHNTYGFSIFLCAGLLPWQYFTETIGRLQGVFIEQANLMKKVAFPRSTLPTYVLGSATVNFAINYALFWVFLAVSGNLPGWTALAVIPLLLIQQALAVGLGVFLGTLNVFFRDVGHAVGIVLQFWFWLTPVIYPLKAIPDRYHWLFAANPMLPIAQAYQNAFVYAQWPHWHLLAPSIAWAVVFLGLGGFTFSKLSQEMVDEL
jgi:lipopolysaccharide transport system permease protein